MHTIEPYFRWLDLYDSAKDEQSPFYEKDYSEFHYTNQIYNFLLHPRWDDIGSESLYVKVLYADYEQGYTIIELIGEWNDCINNDIANLKAELIDVMVDAGITKFVLIGENVLNAHIENDLYYDEWFQDIEEGWIAAINFRQHVCEEFSQYNVDSYLNFGGELDTMAWRTLKPEFVFNAVERNILKRLGE